MALVSYVTSVQHFNITIPNGELSASANLAGGTDEELCVPFFTFQSNNADNYWDTIGVDIYFSAGSPPTITATRFQHTFGQAVYVSVFVVEFDGTNVDVQQGTFFMIGGLDSTDEVAITEVDLTKTAAVFAYKGDYAMDDWDDVMTRCYFSDSTHIYFKRHNNGMTISGHWFTFEAQGTEFSVEDFTITLSSAQGSDTISSVTMGRTMIVSSFESEEPGDDVNEGSVRVWLEDATNVYAECGSYAQPIVVSGFAIQFNATDGVDVQRGIFNMASTTLTDTDDITAVTLANSIVHNSSFGGLGESDSNGAGDVPASFVEYNFTDLDTVDGERKVHGVSVIAHNWEVIDFTAGAPPAGNIDTVMGVTWANVDTILATTDTNVDDVMGVDSGE